MWDFDLQVSRMAGDSFALLFMVLPALEGSTGLHFPS